MQLFTGLLVLALLFGSGESLHHPQQRLASALAKNNKAKKLPPLQSSLSVSLGSRERQTPSSADCEEKWFDQWIDHYNFSPPPGGKHRYRQRYFVCGREHWKRPDGPIFFYTGNEADVTLYVNHSGIIWENQQEFGALAIYAEHRYFGKSSPFNGKETKDHSLLSFLTPDQALADYAVLLSAFKREERATGPVIAFGGSYGGMLSSWMRIKYPSLIAGAIAGSAPVIGFLGQTVDYDYERYAEIVTRDASAAGGATDKCKWNIHRSWKVLFDYAKTEKGRVKLKTSFRLCKDLKHEKDAWVLANAVSGALSFYAMGSYPYPSSYMLNGDGVLPAFPMRVACNAMEKEVETEREKEDEEEEKLLAGLREVAGIFYNYSHGLECFDYETNDDTSIDGQLWDYISCSSTYIPFGTEGWPRDMFWRQPFSRKDEEKRCLQSWGLSPRFDWPVQNYGADAFVASPSKTSSTSFSNIVFSNGEYDPWMGAGVVQDIGKSVKAIVIKEAGHHYDFMFSHPLDSEDVKAARAEEKKVMKEWIKEYNKEKKSAIFGLDDLHFPSDIARIAL